jgi:hypothetical protein
VEVRAQLSPARSLDVGSVTLHDVRILEGWVRDTEGDSIGLFTHKLRTGYGLSQHTNGAVFYFSRSDFARLEQRRLVATKTAIAAGAVAAELLVTADMALATGGGSETGDVGSGDAFKVVRPSPLGMLRIR